MGIVLATILGTLIGIGRLSGNWLLARLTAFYVETLRDIPLLLQLLFWYALLHNLPAPRQALHVGNTVFLSNRGMKLPLLSMAPGARLGAAGILAGVVGTDPVEPPCASAAGWHPASGPPSGRWHSACCCRNAAGRSGQHWARR